MRKILWLLILLSVLCIAADEMRYTPTLTSFNNGQVSPLMEARTDFDKYKSSCRRLENMFVTAQGPVTRRSGTKYICEVKDSNYPTRLIPFEYSTEDTYIIECGNEYMRFFRSGGQILTGQGTEYLGALTPVAHWTCNDDEPSTTVVDAMGSHDGTATTYTSNLSEVGNVNDCFNLGGDRYFTVPDHADFTFDDSGDNPLTLTGWFFVTDTGEIQTLIAKWEDGVAQEYKLWMDKDRKLTLTLSTAVANLSGNCVSQWKLNETSGTTVTDSQGTQNGVATTDTSNLMAAGATANTGTSFDLDNQYYVNVADHASHTFGNGAADSAFSLAAWVYVPQYPADTIISKRDDTSGALKKEYILYASLSDIYFTISDNSTGGYRRVQSNSNYFNWPPSWGWHFIVATYDGTGGTNAQNGMEIYIDGVNETNARESSGTYVAMENTAAPVLIGAHEDTSGAITGLWNKRIDNVMIFNKELSAGEVLALYNGGEGTENIVIGSTTYAKTDEAIDIGWHFIAVTYDATGGATAADHITFFIDGSEVASTAYNNAAYTNMSNSAANVTVGSENGQHNWASRIDNIAIFDVNLTAAEIAGLYTVAPYEITTPYDSNEIWDLKYTQVDNEMYIVDGNHIPQRLARAGHIDWTLSDFDYSTGPFMAENKDTSITIDPPEAASDITSGDYAIASTETAGYTKDEAFDNLYLVVGNAWRATGKENQWIGQIFGAPKTIKRIKIHPCVYESNLDMCMKYIKIEASEDGVTYVKVPINRWLGRCESYNGDEAWVDYITTYAEYIDLYLNNDTAYQYWRVWIYDNWGDALTGVMEIEMFEEQSGVYTASSNIFNEGHTGSIWRINQERGTSILKGTVAAAAINADGTYVSDTTPWFSGGYSFITTNSSPKFTVTLQRSTNWGATWQSALTPLNSADFDNPAETEKTGAIYRVKISDYVSGTCNYTLTITDQTNHGIIRINSYVSPTSVIATELVPLVHSDPTMTWSEGYWSNYRGWPKTVETHQERLVFGGSKSFPQTLWFGKANPDNYEDFTEGALDDNAFTVALPGQNPIQWVSSRDYLMIGTSGSVGKWGEQGKPVTPTSPSYQEQSRVGSSKLMNVLASDALLYIERGATKVREFVYSLQYDKYMSPDLTLLSENILESGVRDLVFQERPEPILWCVKNNGDIATMTYQREQSITGWAIHNTDGDFESIARIPGATNEDEIWVTVAREIDSVTRRYIEQFQPRDWGTDINDCWFVDCGLAYDGVDGNNFDGLDHLEGLRLSILGDGVIEPNEVVTSGEITIDRDAGRVTAGLPFTSVIETLPLYFDEQDKAHNKKVTTLGFDLYKTGYCKYGVGTDSTLMNINFENDMNTDPNATVQDLYTSVYKLMGVRCPWGSLQKNTIRLESDAPLPLTLRSISLDLRIYPPQ